MGKGPESETRKESKGKNGDGLNLMETVKI